MSATAGRTDTVRNLLERCYRHQVNDVGVGQHGIMRMRVDDWNDGLIYTWAQKDFKECVETSESVLNSAMAAWVFDEYARLLDYADPSSALAQEVRATANLHRDATRAQWNGKWFKRAWMGPELGWLGDATLWIEPQPWAILAGATTDTQTRELVQTMNELLRRGPLGATQMSDGPDMRSVGGTNVGTLELGAIWPSLNQTLTWALMGVDPALAWEEWKRNSLACHADAYPDTWYGVWSGNDSYNSPLSQHPGGAANEPFFHGTDFPVLNLHSHACSLYSATKLVGLEFTGEGLNLNLTLPLESYQPRLAARWRHQESGTNGRLVRSLACRKVDGAHHSSCGSGRKALPCRCEWETCSAQEAAQWSDRVRRHWFLARTDALGNRQKVGS